MTSFPDPPPHNKQSWRTKVEYQLRDKAAKWAPKLLARWDARKSGK